MTGKTVHTIEKILSDVDGTMRRRLAKQGLVDTDQVQEIGEGKPN